MPCVLSLLMIPVLGSLLIKIIPGLLVCVLSLFELVNGVHAWFYSM